MNEERFDDLTRALATNRLSRRQVLKSFAAGVLLAGPLGTLVQKAGVAQTLDCVATRCVRGAKRKYAECNDRCRKVAKRKRAECLEGCQASYSGNLANCGCVTVDTDTATGKVAYAPCADPCTPQTLSEQAHQDPHYSKLADFLTANGFAADEGPTSVVSQQDGQLVRSQLGGTFSHPTRTNESATLSYIVEVSGDTQAFAYVWDNQNENLLYLLAVDEAGFVQKVNLPEDSQQTSGPNAISMAAAGGSCNSEQMSECQSEARKDFYTCLAEIPPTPNPRRRLARRAVCALKLAEDLLDCSDPPTGCGPLSDFWCSNDVCCRLSETGCGGTSCCNACERCENGSCVAALCAGTGSTCCKGPWNHVCCSPCEYCQADLLGGVQCATNMDLKPCGEACCGSCQTCDDPTTGRCRNCNSCETCTGAGDCVPNPGAKPCGEACCGSCQVCDGGQCRNCNQCETCAASGNCVPKANVGVASASGLAAPLAAASTTPCNGQCCDVCQECSSTGCVPKQCPPCETCDPQSNACVPTQTCSGGKVLDTATCQCVCPEGWETCGASDVCCNSADCQQCQSTSGGWICIGCPDNTTCCNGGCFHLPNDQRNCGACGNNCLEKCTGGGGRCCDGVCVVTATTCDDARVC